MGTGVGARRNQNTLSPTTSEHLPGESQSSILWAFAVIDRAQRIMVDKYHIE